MGFTIGSEFQQSDGAGSLILWAPFGNLSKCKVEEREKQSCCDTPLQNQSASVDFCVLRG